MFLQTNNLDFNLEVLKQIYKTMSIIAEGHFNSVDKELNFKVIYLVFMNKKLENISV
jgi:hypothetical protein